MSCAPSRWRTREQIAEALALEAARRRRVEDEGEHRCAECGGPNPDAPAYQWCYDCENPKEVRR